MSQLRRASVELLGTFWLVFGGCGSAVFAAAFPETGIGFLGVSFAFGFSVLTMSYAISHISGYHLNPAVTLGLWAGGRFPVKDILPYILAQTAGAVIAATALYLIASGKANYDLTIQGLGANGFGMASPGGYSLTSGFLIEMILSFGFVIVIMGATDTRVPEGFAPITIGLALTLIHLISIPITNTSVNPARSTGPALIQGGIALQQLWMFWVAPPIGGLLGGLIYRVLASEELEIKAAGAREQTL